MEVKIRADSVEIEGYVNAIERDSRPLMSRVGRFIERVCKGAFKKALARADDVKILLNHDWNRQLGSTAQGNLVLEEDAIGLHARATITDPEVMEDARKGNLVGWSFGFHDRDVENSMEEGMPLRKIRDLDLAEVSLINRAMTPCYEGTLVSVRAEDGTTEEQMLYRADIMTEDEAKVKTTVETTVEKTVEKTVETTVEEKQAKEKSIVEGENQEPKDPLVEKPVEKNGKMNYNKAINIIKKLKED